MQIYHTIYKCTKWLMCWCAVKKLPTNLCEYRSNYW